MTLRIFSWAFLTSVLLLGLLLLCKDSFSAFAPLFVLYMIGFAVIAFINCIGLLLGLSTRIVYPISFALSLFAWFGALSWLSGNSYLETLQTVFWNRKDVFSMADPYIIGNIVSYLMACTKKVTQVNQ